MKIQLARREFLRKMGIGAAAGVLSTTITNSLAGQILRQAFAATNATSPNPSGYYLYLTFPGGPPRWFFDLPLTPSGTSDAFTPGAFGTALATSSGNTRAVYASKKMSIAGRDVHLPPVWGMDLAGNRRLVDVLENAVMIRGMNNRINSHEISARQQVAPIFGGTSLNGAVADGANRPIPAIVDPFSTASGAYRSSKGFAATQIDHSLTGGRNSATNLLAPFRSWFGNRPIHSAQSAALQSQALNQFDLFAQQRGITNSRLSEMYDNAIQLVDENIFTIADQWAPTVSKYQALVDEALHPVKGELPGLFDSPIVATAGDDPSTAINSDEDTFVAFKDKRDMITSTYSAPYMAENFALAELALDRLTCSMSLAFRGCENLAISGTGANLSYYDVTHDQHHIGSVISTVATTLFYRAFTACLGESVAVLKDRGLFNQTMIHIASEFNRVPVNSSGSGHGASASNSTLISGKIKGFSVIGNIEVDGPFGTYGVSSPFAVGKSGSYGREIQVNDVARTVSLMLGIEDVTTNGMALLSPESSGLWVPTFSEAINVKA